MLNKGKDRKNIQVCKATIELIILHLFKVFPH